MMVAPLGPITAADETPRAFVLPTTEAEIQNKRSYKRYVADKFINIHSGL